ncbi:MAG: cyclophilin-like fold protein, partial [Nostoc sp.]
KYSDNFSLNALRISGFCLSSRLYFALHIGDVIYWSPGPDVAIYYRHDGEEIPDPGIIAIGKIDAGVEAFNVPGSVEVTIELVQSQ